MINDEKIQEIISQVLGFSEEDQYDWFEENFELEGWNSKSGFIPTESMCDAAFRMRDEMMHEDSDRWAAGCWYVTCWCMFKMIQDPPIDNIQKRINAEQYVLSRSAMYWMVAIYIAKLLKETIE